MNGLRQDFIDAMSDRWDGDAESLAEYTAAADDLLRVLAEHGDTQQVREQLAHVLMTWQPDDLVNGLMAIVAPIVAARDAAVQQTQILAAELASVVRQENESHIALVATQALHQPIKRYHDGSGEWSTDTPQAAADYAAIDLSDVEHFEVCKHCGFIETWALGENDMDYDYREALWPCATAKVLGLDAPARPAGHDESGQ